MYVSNGGVGESIYIEHGTSTAEGILINTGGASTGLRISTGHASAYGISVEDNEGSSNPGITVSQGGTGAGVSVTQYGTGRGVYINLSSTSNAAAGLDILYPGNGNGININKSPTTSKAGYGLGVTMGANCTGDGINLSTANSTDGSTGIRVTSAPTTSAAVTIYGAQISVTSGTTFQNRALYLSASGGTTNYALYANAGDTYLNGALTVTGNTQLGDAGTDTLAIYPTSTTLYSQVGSAPAWLNAIFGTTLHPTGLITNVAKVGGIQAGDPVIATLRGADSAASDAGMVMLLGGDATASNYKGGWALSMGGVGFGSGSGGNCLGIAGAGGATGAGGDAMLWSGAGGATTGNSGVLTLTTGATTSGNSGEATLSTGIPASGSSGKITISTGGTTTGSSGTAELRTGAVATTGSSGSITIVTGNTADVSGVSGSISLEIGTAAGGTGGTVNLAYTGTTATVRIGQPTSTVNVYPYFATFAPTASSYTTKSILGTTLAIAGIVTAQPDDGAGHQGFTTVRGCDRTTAGKAGSSMLLGGDHNGNNGEGGITAVISGKGGASDGTAGAGAGGAVVVYTGLGGTASGTYPGGKGGDLLLWGNTGGAGTATGNAGHGGDIQLAAGAAGAANGGNGERGGDINLGAGTGTGTGRGGRIGIDSGVGGGGAGESITIGGSNAASLALGRAAITTTINGTLNLGGSACSANVTGTNLSTLTAGASSDASALHTHVGMPLSSNYTAGTGGVTQYDVVYLANDGGNLRAFPAFATSETTTRPIGLAMATAAAGISFAAALGGEYTAHFDSTPAAADAGKPVYLSVSAAGQVSLTAPTTTGQVSMRIGYLAQISGTAYCKIALHIGDPFVQ